MRQRLGQHFLLNKEKIREIIDALELNKGDFIIEVGAGGGELTDELRSRNHELRIIAVEKDKKLADKLREKFGTGNIEVIHGDALKLLPSLIHDSKFIIHDYKIVGNIPYYITGRLFRILGGLRVRPELVVLTLQKEVALRLIAKPPKTNLLSASVQFWAKPEIVGFISKRDFSPPPEVHSAIIRLRIKNYEPGVRDDYYRLIKMLFKQPRKTILNNLAQGLSLPKEGLLEKLKNLGVKPGDRPQNLGLEEIKRLAELV